MRHLLTQWNEAFVYRTRCQWISIISIIIIIVGSGRSAYYYCTTTSTGYTGQQLFGAQLDHLSRHAPAAAVLLLLLLLLRAAGHSSNNFPSPHDTMFTIVRPHELNGIHNGPRYRRCVVAVADEHTIDEPRSGLVRDYISFFQ